MKNTFYKSNYTAGFSLVELLVVIAIIGVLSSMLMANFHGYRERARDAQRKTDLAQIRSAWELYRADQGFYPSTRPACGASLTVTGVTYINRMPCDPNTGAGYTYTTSPPAPAQANSYTLYACLENASDGDRDATRQATCTVASYTVANP